MQPVRLSRFRTQIESFRYEVLSGFDTLAARKISMRRILDFVGLALLAVLAWITYRALYGPDPLPQRIPTHFGANGQPNAWGPPGSLWLLPIVGAGLYLIISVVGLFPASFNFPVRSTPVNRPRMEALTLLMMAWVKMELCCLFLTIQWSIIQSVRGGNAALSPAIMPLFLAVVFVTVAGHGIAVFRAARLRA
jgi:uncharacterized membrane protein